MASSSSTTSIRPWPARLCDCERAYCIVKKTKTQETRGRDYYSCPIFGTPCANFIQWCDDHQAGEQAIPEASKYVSNPSKQDGELMKQLMLIQTCILVVILLVLLWKL